MLSALYQGTRFRHKIIEILFQLQGRQDRIVRTFSVAQKTLMRISIQLLYHAIFLIIIINNFFSQWCLLISYPLHGPPKLLIGSWLSIAIYRINFSLYTSIYLLRKEPGSTSTEALFLNTFSAFFISLLSQLRTAASLPNPRTWKCPGTETFSLGVRSEKGPLHSLPQKESDFFFF